MEMKQNKIYGNCQRFKPITRMDLGTAKQLYNLSVQLEYQNREQELKAARFRELKRQDLLKRK